MGVGKRIKRNGKLNYEHREVMELYLGRPLEINEVIHHLDGNPFNNNINNLELLTRGQHTACHNKTDSNPSRKLSKEQVWEIRKLYADGFGCRRIARMFKIGKSTARDIKNRKTWDYI